MMKKAFYIVVVAIVFAGLASSCNIDDNDAELIKREQTLLEDYLTTNKITTAPTESGLYFILKDTGTGVKPVIGNYILVNYTIKLINGTLIETDNVKLADEKDILPSITIGGPMQLKVVTEYIQGLKEGILNMHEGDSVLLIIPSKLAYGSGFSAVIPSYSTLLYNIRLKKVITDIDAYDKANRDSVVINRFKKQLKDSVAQDLYINILDDTTYVGDSINSDTTVTLKYRGYLVDGRMFTSKDSLQTYTFTVDISNTIEGFNIAFKKLRKGTKAEILIPYWNAYKETGVIDNQTQQIIIPPYSSVLFYVEIQNK